MSFLKRDIQEVIIENLHPQKVLVLVGPRRVGKTVLIKQIIEKTQLPYLLLNGEDFSVVETLQRRSIRNYQNLLGGKKLLLIDEAQRIPEIGAILKLIVDEIEDIRIMVTGSSAFDIQKYTGEPLTGRKKTFNLFALSEHELEQHLNPIDKQEDLRFRLIFGNYPELIHLHSNNERTEYLREIVNSYLLKDILAFENIRKADKILHLLRLIAFQVGSEVYSHELGQRLSMNKKTVEKYLDLLSKVYVIHKLGGFSRNLRKEVTKSGKWYFYDNGLRNILVANMNPLELRNDIRQLWENYVISERLKQQAYDRTLVNNYFWRTHDQQEIDWVEDRGGRLYGYEFKWNPKAKSKIPTAWRKAYPDAGFKIVHRENYLEWLEEKVTLG